VAQSAPIQLPLPPSPSMYRPAPALAEIRDRQPVARVSLPDGRQAWLATGHAEVRQVLVERSSSSTRRPANLRTLTPLVAQAHPTGGYRVSCSRS
jgi:cytochrome P450